MAQPELPTWLLEQEARALLTRLDRVKPFALQEPMLPAAALSPAAQVGIEEYLLKGRRSLRRQVLRYIAWLQGSGRSVRPDQQQRHFTFLKLRFNLELSQLDMFSEVVTQRSEHDIGVWLSGLDVAAQDALRLAGGVIDPPPIACYLHRGMGGAIRRARTRLPGGGSNPVAIIRIPRERMIGYGISSSLVHEVGHQAAAILGLVESLRPAIQHARTQSSPEDGEAWRQWERWISEIVADVWSIARVGVSSTMGLMGLVSLPRAFVFRSNRDDPHPFGWIRVQLSCAFGDAFYPDPQWRQLGRIWATFYPTEGLKPEEARNVDALMRTMPAFVALLLNHRPLSLRGRSLAETLWMPDRSPAQLLALYRAWQRDRRMLRRTAPTLAFAVTGQARARGELTPEEESRILGDIISYWALDSAMQENARSVAAAKAARPIPPSLLPSYVVPVDGRSRTAPRRPLTRRRSDPSRYPSFSRRAPMRTSMSSRR